MEELKLGDTVMLKSGGPVMTVHGIINADKIICKWFSKDDLINEEYFKKETLRRYYFPIT